LLNWSYSTAVFTDPGSPLAQNNGYSHLPSQEEGGPQYTTFTVKSSTGDLRFCNKCQTKKPDRSHHCSTCKRCVLKMDHHCPWLATCVGLRNYKAFVLFLVYTTLFCWVCFATSATWVWTEILQDAQVSESFMPVNYVLLAVISGIIGLVLTGFTAWHLWLSAKGQTTIESLEKTRYLSPIRNSMKAQLNDRNYVDAQAHGRASISDQLREIHANALPGVTRPEEGESRSRSPAPTPTTSNGYPSHSYEQRERQQNQDRYDSYLEERDNELLPNAFDLGWKRNFAHVFGPSPFLWPFPLRTTTGDGWSWEAGPQWVAACERIKREREAEDRVQKQRELAAGWGVDSPTEVEFRRTTGTTSSRSYPEQQQHPRFSPPRTRTRAPRRPEWQQAPRRRDEDSRYLMTSNGIVSTPQQGRRSPSKADQILGRESGMYTDRDGAGDGGGGGGDVQMQDLDRKGKFDLYNYISDDEEGDEDGYEEAAGEERREGAPLPRIVPMPKHTKDWNDIPDDFINVNGNVVAKGRAASRKRSMSPGTRTTGQERDTAGGGEWDDWGKDD
jgi:hypothetical protein